LRRTPVAPRFAPSETWDSTDACIVVTQLKQLRPLDRPPSPEDNGCARQAASFPHFAVTQPG
jgi:hypothetical protein